MDATYAAPAVADRIYDIQRFPIVHVMVCDGLPKQINRIEYPPWSQAIYGKVVCAIIVSYKSAAELLGEINSLCFPRVCYRGAAPIIKANLEANDSL